MNPRHKVPWISIVCAALLYFASAAVAQRTTANASVRTSGGLQTITFDIVNGRVIVHLPDDMMAGDTISGTVVTEPAGSTTEEHAKNQAILERHVLRIGDQNVPVVKKTFTWNVAFAPQKIDSGYKIAIIEIPTTTPPAPTTDPATATITISPFESRDFFWFYQKAKPQQSSPPTDFRLPPIGQQGRSIELFGPFDGNSSNTILMFGPARSTLQDFEKNTENVSGGFGLIRPLAESPRKIVFESPNVTGPVAIMVKEGDVATTGTYRNVGVRLSAPKTNLLRGERTTLTVEVSGLEGIKQDVPLQLDSKGVITMDGGNFQNLRIRPPEVTQDGRYTTTRAITGQQAGGFTVTATVIVSPFDTCLQDDSHPASVVLWNTFTGDYIFTNIGPVGQLKPPGGTVQPGGTKQPPGTTVTPSKVTTPTGINLTGTGKPVMKGCIITLTHNAPDRRVFARLDTCTKTGDASVQTTSPMTTFNITDKNVSDSTCPSPPPQ